MDARFALDGYAVDELIGFGGTGEVWRAREVATGETVALKRLRTRGPAATERLRREAALLATVAGPHVIGVRRFVVEGDEAVLVMDHAAGGSLATVLGVRGRLPAPEVVTVLAPIATALAAAHARDLIHGDITPANILFAADGRPLLADLGVARALGVAPGVGSGAQPVEATLDYLDPAVLAGATPDAASDIFSLGAVGFAALTGGLLWGSGPASQVQARIASGDRASLAESAGRAPDALVAVIESMLVLDPDQRPAAKAVANAVLRACPAAPVGLVHPLAPAPPAVTGPVPLEVAAGGTDRPAVDPATADPAAVDPAAVDPRPRRPWRWLVLTSVVVALVLVGAVAVGIALAHRGGGQARVLAAVRSSPMASGPLASRTPTPPPMSPTSVTSAAPAPSDPGSSAATAGISWLGVIRRLDALRAQVFADADAAPLAAVYVPGATAYTDDLATVRSLASRGLRARGFAASVDRVRVEAATPTSARVRVVDRLSGYELIDGTGRIVGRGTPRPARAFTMSLTKAATGWRVAAVAPA